jgi:hypothetical protein
MVLKTPSSRAGERALLADDTRAATITAESDLCAGLPGAFTRPSRSPP